MSTIRIEVDDIEGPDVFDVSIFDVKSLRELDPRSALNNSQLVCVSVLKTYPLLQFSLLSVLRSVPRPRSSK